MECSAQLHLVSVFVTLLFMAKTALHARKTCLSSFSCFFKCSTNHKLQITNEEEQWCQQQDDACARRNLSKESLSLFSLFLSFFPFSFFLLPPLAPGKKGAPFSPVTAKESYVTDGWPCLADLAFSHGSQNERPWMLKAPDMSGVSLVATCRSQPQQHHTLHTNGKQ